MGHCEDDFVHGVERGGPFSPGQAIETKRFNEKELSIGFRDQTLKHQADRPPKIYLSGRDRWGGSGPGGFGDSNYIPHKD